MAHRDPGWLMKTIGRSLGILVALVAAFLLLKPVPIDPAPWTPTPNAGFTGPFAPNSLLTTADTILMPGPGPEDLTVGPDGAIYAGLADGRLVRIDRTTGAVDSIATTGGRPLGLRFDHAGSLIVADAKRGLLAVSPAGVVRVLTDSGGGKRLNFTDALDIAPDGTIWFSDASQRWDVSTGGLLDFWESRPTGRLLRYDPAAVTTTVALDSVDFANGVAIGPGGAWLLLNETMAGRIRRYWLAGPRAGQSEIFIEGLPGVPDNIGYDGQGIFWVGLFAPRTPETTKIRAMSPFLRKVLYRIPERLRIREAAAYGMVIGIDTLGRVRYNLQDPTGRFFATTGGVVAGDMLYVSTLTRNVVARVALFRQPFGSIRSR